MKPDITDIHARLSVVENTVNRMDKKVDGIATNVSEMKSYQDRQRGAIAVLMIVSGTIGAAIAKAATYIATKVGAA